jgi:PAS domain-containing protein
MHRYIDELRLLQAIRLAVLATDAVGTITFVNRAATEVFATVDAELLGRQVRDLIEPGTSDGPLDLDQVIAGDTWRGDLTLRRPRFPVRHHRPAG